MTERELDRLAQLIADALLRTRAELATPAPSAGGGSSRARRTAPESWLQLPVRPEPPMRGAEPPVWSGAAQELGDVAPGSRGRASSARRSTAELTRATRAAAAGRGAPPTVAPHGRVTRDGGGARTRLLDIEVPIGVSNRHVHLSPEHARALLGRAEPARRRDLSQPGQYAAEERLTVVGPRGRIEAVRVVGPARGVTQVELARSDARRIGIEPPIAASGALESSIGGLTLIGPAGSVVLERGAIVAARHLHLGPDDARRWGLRDGDRVDVRCGGGARAVTLHAVLVRSGPGHATELHLDVDEADAAAVRTGDRATIIAAARASGLSRRPLITERDVQRIARAGGTLPADALLTPSARDRARSLGLVAAP